MTLFMRYSTAKVYSAIQKTGPAPAQAVVLNGGVDLQTLLMSLLTSESSFSFQLKFSSIQQQPVKEKLRAAPWT